MSNKTRILNTTFNGRPAQMRVREFYRHDRLIIAIDPDSAASGVAFIVQGRIERLESIPLLELYKLMPSFKQTGPLVVLEDIDNEKGTWMNGNKGKTRKEQAILRNKAQKVGKAMIAAREIKKMLTEYSIEYVLVDPLTNPEKARAKNDAEYFNALTGWAARSNQDKRDAAMLGLYGVPVEYNTCEHKHVFTGSSCRICERVQRSKERKAARRAAEKKAKALADKAA